jgi:hypothetical protein
LQSVLDCEFVAGSGRHGCGVQEEDHLVERGALALLCVLTRSLSGLCRELLPAIGPRLVCVPWHQLVVENGERWMDDTYTVWSPLECKTKIRHSGLSWEVSPCSVTATAKCYYAWGRPAASKCSKQNRTSSRINGPISSIKREPSWIPFQLASISICKLQSKIKNILSDKTAGLTKQCLIYRPCIFHLL